MRILLILVLFFSAACNSGDAEGQKIDTAKLFDPRPDLPDHDATNMFRNFLIPTKKNYVLFINGFPYEFRTDSELTDSFRSFKTKIATSKFYIVTDSSIAFKKIVATIDLLKKSGIDNYKVIDINKEFRPMELNLPNDKNGPVTVEKKVHQYDSSYFSVEVVDKYYRLKLLDQNILMTDITQVERFIRENRGLIDPSKILLVGEGNAGYESFKAIIELFKKYGYLKFQMVTRPAK